MKTNQSISIAVYEVRDDEKIFLEQEAKALNVKLVQCTDVLNEDTLSLSEGCNGVSILGRSKVDAALIEKLVAINVNILVTRTVGYNHIDIDAAHQLGVRVCNATYDPNGVADYTVMLILMSLRKYKQAMFRANVNDYSLPGLQGREMKDLTIGIIGTGNIGAQVIRNLSGFGAKLLAFDFRHNPAIESFVKYVSLNEIYQNSNIISYHVPLTSITSQMVNTDTISKMKDGVILVNCARGELMSIPDVIENIECQKIGALALDVFENEVGIYHVDRRNDIISNRDMAYIRQFPNVIMTQHIAFYTDAAVRSMVTLALQNVVSIVTTGKSDLEIL